MNENFTKPPRNINFSPNRVNPRWRKMWQKPGILLSFVDGFPYGDKNLGHFNPGGVNRSYGTYSASRYGGLALYVSSSGGVNTNGIISGKDIAPATWGSATQISNCTENTIVVFGIFNAPSGATDYIAAITNPSSTNGCILFSAGGNTSLKRFGFRYSMRMNDGNTITAIAPTYFATSSNMIDGRWLVARWRHGEAPTIRVYDRNGKLELNYTHTSVVTGSMVGLTATSNNYVCIGSGPYGAASITYDAVYYVPIYLTDSDIAELIRDPWAPLREEISHLPVYTGSEAPTGITLYADSGSYSYSGTDASLLYNRLITSETGSYSLIGENVSLLKNYLISSETGSYSLTGNDVSLLRGRLLTLDSGSYLINGVTQNLYYNRKLSVDTGSYILTGNNVEFIRIVNAYEGIYNITGTDVGLYYNRKIFTDTGSYLTTGINSNLYWNRRLSIDTGSYLLTGIDATLTYTPVGVTTIIIDPGTYNLTGADVGLYYNRKISIDVGTYTTSGVNSNLYYNRALSANVGNYTLVGLDSSLLFNRIISLNSDSYSISGINANLLKHYKIMPEIGGYVLSGTDINFIRQYVLVTATGNYLLTGVDLGLTPNVETIIMGVNLTFINELNVDILFTK